MEFLKDDARRIRNRLGQDDRSRFDGYIDTFESLRVRDERRVAIKDQIAKHAPTYSADKYTSLQHMDRMEAQFELAAAGLIAGLTNVITLRPDTLGTLYEGLGFQSLGLHAIGHGAILPNGTDSIQMRKKVDAYHLKLIAKMAQSFDRIPEGNGTMLDNTLIVYLSCAGGKHHAGNTDWPVVLVGGTGAKLKMGRYLQYPAYKRPGHKTLGNLYLNLLAAGGIETGEQFGQLDPALRNIDLKGPLTELMA